MERDTLLVNPNIWNMSELTQRNLPFETRGDFYVVRIPKETQTRETILKAYDEAVNYNKQPKKPMKCANKYALGTSIQDTVSRDKDEILAETLFIKYLYKCCAANEHFISVHGLVDLVELGSNQYFKLKMRVPNNSSKEYVLNILEDFRRKTKAKTVGFDEKMSIIERRINQIDFVYRNAYFQYHKDFLSFITNKDLYEEVLFLIQEVVSKNETGEMHSRPTSAEVKKIPTESNKKKQFISQVQRTASKDIVDANIGQYYNVSNTEIGNECTEIERDLEQYNRINIVTDADIDGYDIQQNMLNPETYVQQSEFGSKSNPEAISKLLSEVRKEPKSSPALMTHLTGRDAEQQSVSSSTVKRRHIDDINPHLDSDLRDGSTSAAQQDAPMDIDDKAEPTENKILETFGVQQYSGCIKSTTSVGENNGLTGQDVDCDAADFATPYPSENQQAIDIVTLEGATSQAEERDPFQSTDSGDMDTD